jgi:integrase
VLADVRRGVWRAPEPPPVQDDPEPQPTFHEFASAWVVRHEGEVGARTAEHWRWALSCHLLKFFGKRTLPEIGVQLVDDYRTAKVGDGVLSHGSINKTLKVLAQVLDEAIEYGYLEVNSARGKRRRLKAAKPKRTWLEPDEVASLLDAAKDHKALIATMALAGLRVGELAALRWSDVDLAGAKLNVRRSKTEAGERTVELSPSLLDELKLHRAKARYAEPSDYVFATRNGTQRNRSNITRQILRPAIEQANAKRAKDERPPLSAGVTNHSLRRTFASLLYEAGASPAYVMSQMGHTSSSLALEVYARKMDRKRDTGERMDALIRSANWAQTGTSAESVAELVNEENGKPADFQRVSRLRG